jgi:hypothetical protein
MSPLMLGMTVVAWSVPVLLALAIARTAGPVAPALELVLGALLLLYGAVWLFMRPSRFEVSDRELVVVWPLRRRSIARGAITSAEVVDRAELRRRFGRGMRVGVGGLWGQFGYSLTAKRGRLDTLLSTMGPWVLLEVSEGRPLLISPDEPEAMVRALGSPSRR